MNMANAYLNKALNWTAIKADDGEIPLCICLIPKEMMQRHARLGIHGGYIHFKTNSLQVPVQAQRKMADGRLQLVRHSKEQTHKLAI